MASHHRTLRESQQYSAQCRELGGARRLDEALLGLLWGISTCPEEFDIVPGFKHLRIGKTDSNETEDSIMPRLRVYFSILDDNTVDLLALHITAED